jgi:hypothetical protein
MDYTNSVAAKMTAKEPTFETHNQLTSFNSFKLTVVTNSKIIATTHNCSSECSATWAGPSGRLTRQSALDTQALLSVSQPKNQIANRCSVTLENFGDAKQQKTVRNKESSAQLESASKIKPVSFGDIARVVSQTTCFPPVLECP